MPFATGARIEIENRADAFLGGPLGMVWFHIEYETFDEPPPQDVLRFHAQYRQERPTTPAMEPRDTQLHPGVNLDGDHNYVALEAQGKGQMVGLVLEVENIAGGWYGEGDDMVFVDGDAWPPRIHGTGHEEVFGAGACVLREYSRPYAGFHLVEDREYRGLVGMYRWYVADPIRFDRSLRWTIEHGHANNFGNDYTSVAYWYQTEPHAPFPALPERDAMRPPLPDGFDEVRMEILTGMAKLAGPAENRSDAPSSPARRWRVRTVRSARHRPAPGQCTTVPSNRMPGHRSAAPSGVRTWCSTPHPRSASTIALMTVGGAPTVPDSPAPFTPIGLLRQRSGRSCIWNDGISSARGMQ